MQWNPLKKPTIITQIFTGDDFLRVTGRNKYGHNVVFRYEKPDDFSRSLSNPYVDYVFTIIGDKIHFWSRENIPQVTIHYIPEEFITK